MDRCDSEIRHRLSSRINDFVFHCHICPWPLDSTNPDVGYMVSAFKISRTGKMLHRLSSPGLPDYVFQVGNKFEFIFENCGECMEVGTFGTREGEQSTTWSRHMEESNLMRRPEVYCFVFLFEQD
eukprot:jgi/Botrbrau1/7319/Bobra.247_3s0014.1